MFESIKDEFTRLSKKVQTLKDNLTSMQLHLIQEMSHLSTRLSMIEATNKEELLSVKERLEESIKKLEAYSSGNPKIPELKASLDQLISKYYSARYVFIN